MLDKLTLDTQPGKETQYSLPNKIHEMLYINKLNFDNKNKKRKSNGGWKLFIGECNLDLAGSNVWKRETRCCMTTTSTEDGK